MHSKPISRRPGNSRAKPVTARPATHRLVERIPVWLLALGWRRCFALAVISAAMFGLICTGLGRMEFLIGDLAPRFDVFAHLMMHLLGMLAGGLVAFAFPRRLIAILASGAAIVVLSHATLAQKGLFVPVATAAASRSISPSTPAGTQSLRVITFNTWHANRDTDAVHNLLVSLNADIVVMQEFGPNKHALLTRLAKIYPYQAGCSDVWHCSVVILSRHAWAMAGVVPRIYSPALRKFVSGPPSAWVRFETSAGPLTVIGGHLFRPIDGARAHKREAVWLAEAAASAGARAPNASVILTGDFNATRWSASFAAFEQVSGLQHMGAFLPSWPSGNRGLPQLAIDHIWASKELTFEDVGLGPHAGSDHRPVIAQIRLKPGQHIIALD